MPEGICKQVIPEEEAVPETKIKVETIVEKGGHDYRVEVETEDSPYVIPDMVDILDEILHGKQ